MGINGSVATTLILYSPDGSLVERKEGRTEGVNLATFDEYMSTVPNNGNSIKVKKCNKILKY